MRTLAFLLVVALPAGCGGMVVYDEDDGSGGGSESFGCVGGCGSTCTKCVDDACFTGSCDADGQCIPPDAPLVCVD